MTVYDSFSEMSCTLYFIYTIYKGSFCNGLCCCRISGQEARHHLTADVRLSPLISILLITKWLQLTQKQPPGRYHKQRLEVHMMSFNRLIASHIYNAGLSDSNSWDPMLHVYIRVS